MAATLVAGVGAAGAAMAQGDVIAERRAGLRQMEQHLEAIGAIVQSRGDQGPIGARVDQMVAFYTALPNRVPAPRACCV
jgi:cytochrome c556